MNHDNSPEVLAIGDPGQAALEVPDGPPPSAIGPSDIELSSATLPGMVVRAASSRGLQHRAEHTLRQDSFALGQAADRSAVVVVCDGVGSLSRSDYAAGYASERLAQLGAAGEPWPAAFTSVNADLAKVAAEAKATGFGAMATTAVALRATWSAGLWRGEVAWVGDSSLWHLGDDGTWRPITLAADPGGDGGYHSGKVRPMPTPEGDCSWCSFALRGGALFAMTDGVGNPLAWSGEVRDTLARWWARPPDPLAFAAQVGFARKSHIDDRTAVGIWPHGE